MEHKTDDFIEMISRSSDGKEIKRRVPITREGVSGKSEHVDSSLVETSNYVSVETNPSNGNILEAVNSTRHNGGRVIFEVGCNDKISICLGKNDLWVGADPGVNSKITHLNKGRNKIFSSSRRLMSISSVSDLPEVNPDLVLMVAPNPADIVDKNMLSDVTEKLMNGETKLLLILDTQSYESVLNLESLKMDGSGLEEVKKNISDNFGLDKFEIEIEEWTDDEISKEDMLDIVGIPNPIKINSNFLQGQEKLVVLVRKR